MKTNDPTHHLRLPAITKAQVLAHVQGGIALAVAFGVNLNESQQAALLSFSALAYTVLVAADTLLRRGRQRHLGGLLADLARDPEGFMAALGATDPAPWKPPGRAAVSGETPAPVRQLRTLEAEAAAQADVEAEQPPAEPGTYGPAGDEPTGS